MRGKPWSLSKSRPRSPSPLACLISLATGAFLSRLTTPAAAHADDDAIAKAHAPAPRSRPRPTLSGRQGMAIQEGPPLPAGLRPESTLHEGAAEKLQAGDYYASK